MRLLATVKALLAALLVLSPITSYADDDEIKFRFINNEDGTRTEFHKLGNKRTLIKRTYTAAGALQVVAIYKTGPGGRYLSCQIFDAKRTQLYYSTYGYDKKTGQLAEEQMWDARTERISKDTGKVTPIRRFLYTYDAQGRVQRPIALTLIEGLLADDIYGGPTGITEDIFAEPQR